MSFSGCSSLLKSCGQRLIRPVKVSTFLPHAHILWIPVGRRPQTDLHGSCHRFQIGRRELAAEPAATYVMEVQLHMAFLVRLARCALGFGTWMSLPHPSSSFVSWLCLPESTRHQIVRLIRCCFCAPFPSHLGSHPFPDSSSVHHSTCTSMLL